MTRKEAIAILENEKKCVNRASKNDYCNRDCYNCELVKTDTEILNALDMAIKVLEQEPILDKIRTEIETKYGQCDICEYFEDYDYEENDISEYRPIGDIADILQIIDKYKGDKE